MSGLVELLRSCTVKVIGKSNSGYGTGFFVAPGQVLTCAHVIGDEEQSQVTIVWNENSTTATVENYIVEGATNQSHLQWPDLALLGVDIKHHPCVLLLPDFSVGDELYSFGYTDEFKEGDSTTAVVEGVTGFPQMMKFKLGQVRPGLSGSPLLNLQTGGVCGIVKRTRNRANDLGGRAVTTRTVIENLSNLVTIQAKFHQQYGIWIREMNTKQQSLIQQIPRAAKRNIAKIGFTDQPRADIAINLYWQLQNSVPNMKPYGEWTLASPVTAYVSTMVTDPSDSKTMYAGMHNNQGIFRSVDGGLSWDPASIGLGCKSINSLKVSPHDNMIYAMTKNGVWTSNNRGATWEWYNDNWKGENVLSILLSSADPDLIAFGTQAKAMGGIGMSVTTAMSASSREEQKPKPGLAGGNLHITKNKGKDWVTFPIKTVNDFLYSPHDERVAFIASIDDGLYVTRDGFESLMPVYSMMNNKPNKLAMPLDNEDVIAVGSQKGLYLSYDGGETWHHCDQVGDDQVADVVFINGSTHHILAASKKGLFESTDGGESWQQAYDGIKYCWSMAIVQTPDGNTFVGTSGGGVYQRGKKRRNWVARNLGFPTASCSSLAVSQGYFFAAGNGIYRSSDDGNSWEYTGLENQLVLSIAVTASKPTSNQPVAVAGVRLTRSGGRSWNAIDTSKNNTIFVGTTKQIYISEDNGTTWNVLASFDTTSHSSQVRDILLSSKVSGLIYANVAGSGLYRSWDWGNSWEKLDIFVFKDYLLNSVKLFHRPDEVLFACSAEGTVWWSSDNADSWTCSNTKFDHPVIDVTQSIDGQKLYITLSIGSVYESMNEGKDFIQIRPVEDSEKTPRWATLFVHPQLKGYLVLGTSMGAFLSKDDGRTWQEIQAGLMGMSYYINSFLFHNGILYAAMREGIFALNSTLLNSI